MLQRLVVAIAWALIFSWSNQASAQSDEIQVYDGGLANPGTFNLTWHNNYTFKGPTTPSEPGGIAVNHALNGVTEWAYGVNRWLELGLYLPLYTFGNGHAVTDGFKLRALVAKPDAAHQHFFYGLGFELSKNAKRWDSHDITSEFRPIVGWHMNKWDVIFNPILDTAYDGFDKLVFAPSTRIAYNYSDRYAVALEEYADFGEISHLASGDEQSHQLFAVLDYAGTRFEIQGGLGFGLTRAADDLVGKLIVAWDLN
jgi:hypothetical protein